jgi:hypothetical protein
MYPLPDEETAGRAPLPGSGDAVGAPRAAPLSFHLAAAPEEERDEEEPTAAPRMSQEVEPM